MQKETKVTKCLTSQGLNYFYEKLMDYATNNIQEGKELLALQYTKELIHELNSDPEVIHNKTGYFNFEIMKKHVKEYRSKVGLLKKHKML